MKPKHYLVLGQVVGCALSAAGGYFLAKGVLEQKYQAKLSEEIEQARVFYQNLYSRQDIVLDAEVPAEEEDHLNEQTVPPLVEAEPQRKVQEAMEARATYEGEEEVEDKNVFETPVPPGPAVLDALLAERDTDAPYIITKEEFLDNEPEHEQIAFTWFELDSVLIKDDDEFAPIENVDYVAGRDNLYHFGYGSEDSEVLYVRNENTSPPYDLHITRSPGSYVHEVINGGEVDDDSPHLQHSQRKFRLNYE